MYLSFEIPITPSIFRKLSFDTIQQLYSGNILLFQLNLASIIAFPQTLTNKYRSSKLLIWLLFCSHWRYFVEITSHFSIYHRFTIALIAFIIRINRRYPHIKLPNPGSFTTVV